MSSSRSRNSDPLSHSHRASSLSRNDTGLGSSTSMTVDGLLRDINSSSESTLLDAQITLADAPPSSSSTAKSADQVWREIISGRGGSGDTHRLPKQPKEEVPDEMMMTLEDFLAQAGATPKEEEVDGEVLEDEDVKAPLPLAAQRLSGGVFSFDKVEFGSSGKRGSGVLEPLDKAAAQRQRRMIKNRESAARSRERKQAYQVELEALAVKLEEENDRLLKEKEERTRERHKQLMEKLIPIVDKPKTVRVFRRVRSFQW